MALKEQLCYKFYTWVNIFTVQKPGAYKLSY